MKTIYIAYGSNLNHEQMAKRCPKASYIGSTILKGWRLIFKSVATIEKDVRKEVPVGFLKLVISAKKLWMFMKITHSSMTNIN